MVLAVIKLAVVKFAGMGAGGTERFLQEVAAQIDPTRFSVTYFYCDSAPYIGSNFLHPGTDSVRLERMKDSRVQLVEFQVGAKDVRRPDHPWIDTNFWDVFEEGAFDIVQTGRAGHPEYPFTKIRTTPIVDSIHLNAGVSNQPNIRQVLLLSEWSRRIWIRNGGDPKRVSVVSHPVPEAPTPEEDLRKGLGLDGKVVFGMHQRPDPAIFSSVPLESYAQIETDETAMVILGGGPQYSEQARKLGLRHFRQLEFSSSSTYVADFLRALDVYSHGRWDGEINSVAIAEAMRGHLPLVTHVSRLNQGHVEQVEGVGVVARSTTEYRDAMRLLRDSAPMRLEYGLLSRRRFESRYNVERQISTIESVYERVVHGKTVQTAPLVLRTHEVLGRLHRTSRALRIRRIAMGQPAP